jgi:hypothetical protein
MYFLISFLPDGTVSAVGHGVEVGISHEVKKCSNSKFCYLTPYKGYLHKNIGFLFAGPILQMALIDLLRKVFLNGEE